MFLVSTFNNRLIITFDKVISQACVKIIHKETVISKKMISNCNMTAISLSRKFAEIKVQLTENEHTESRTIFF